MGINYSKISCVDTEKKCSQLTPIQYLVYSKNIKGKNQEQIKQYVCGNKVGQITQCCDPFDPAANDIVEDSQLIDVIRDNNGKYTNFRVCECDTKDQKCIDQYCKGYKLPTQYEKCKARNQYNNNVCQCTEQQRKDPKNNCDKCNTRFNPKVYDIVASNAYDNCYALCQ